MGYIEMQLLNKWMNERQNERMSEYFEYFTPSIVYWWRLMELLTLVPVTVFLWSYPLATVYINILLLHHYFMKMYYSAVCLAWAQSNMFISFEIGPFPWKAISLLHLCPPPPSQKKDKSSMVFWVDYISTCCKLLSSESLWLVSLPPSPPPPTTTSTTTPAYFR